METSGIGKEDLRSIQLALGASILRRAMNQDAPMVDKLLQSMEETTAKMMELSVTPHRGANLDVTA